MNIQFTQSTTGAYESEFIMNGATNVHLEGSGNEYVTVYQRGTDTGTHAFSQVVKTRNHAFDFDLCALVYPKYIKLLTYNQITTATVSGDVSAITRGDFNSDFNADFGE